MEMNINDRISNLPGNIVDNILCRLTLRDAVRTSILSHDWRYKWTKLTNLVFDPKSLQLSSQCPTDKMVKIVDHVLLLHDGSIHKFKLHLSSGVCDIDRWVLFLSRRSVKEIILEVDSYKIPSSLYLCDKLSHLELKGCWLGPSSAFNGFKNLTCLYLGRKSIDKDYLENLIYSCPSLERLTLYGLDHLDQFKIHAPRLTFLDFVGGFNDVSFENTVRLFTVSIQVWGVFHNDHTS